MSLQQSKAYQYVLQKGWSFKESGDELNIEICPISKCDNWHFYISVSEGKDGLWDCKKCGESGNLYQLSEFLGDKLKGTMSVKDLAKAEQEPIPDIEAFHKALMNEEGLSTALDYLVNERGFSIDTIEKYKLGLCIKNSKRFISIPYITQGNVIYVKYRSVPPEPKQFFGIRGREAPIFNQDALVPNIEVLYIVEGEPDCLAMLNQGIQNVIGVPGANTKKTTWIKYFDEMNIGNIYLLYDTDKPGQKGAYEMAKKIGLEKCKNIILPYFDNPNAKPGKLDVNDWFRYGEGSIEKLEELTKAAKIFNVEGIYSIPEAIQELTDELLTKGTLAPSYVSGWPSLNRIMGGCEDGDVIGILAQGKTGKTTLAMNWLDFLVREYKQAGLLYCLEMLPKRLVKKWISYVTETNDEDINLETISDACTIAGTYEADLLFGYNSTRDFKEVAETIRQAVRRYGVKFVCFDNLHMLCRSMDHAVQEASLLSKGFKALAMELNIVILLILQPHRVREGDIVTSANAKGTADFEKDVDYMVCLHRERVGVLKAKDLEQAGFIDIPESFSSTMYVRLDLSRYSAGGTVALHMDGAMSKVKEFSNVSEVNKVDETVLI